MHIFHKWIREDDDLRRCSVCKKRMGFSAELGRWKEIDFLACTNYDAGYWLVRY